MKKSEIDFRNYLEELISESVGRGLPTSAPLLAVLLVFRNDDKLNKALVHLEEISECREKFNRGLWLLSSFRRDLVLGQVYTGPVTSDDRVPWKNLLGWILTLGGASGEWAPGSWVGRVVGRLAKLVWTWSRQELCRALESGDGGDEGGAGGAPSWDD
jgi:hypothetical protein